MSAMGIVLKYSVCYNPSKVEVDGHASKRDKPSLIHRSAIIDTGYHEWNILTKVLFEQQTG